MAVHCRFIADGKMRIFREQYTVCGIGGYREVTCLGGSTLDVFAGSLGGVAMLAAAQLLHDIRAVTTIGVPCEIAHLLGDTDPETIKQIDDGGRGRSTLGGRAIRIGRSLVDDLRHHDQGERIATLRRPLLLPHSPIDQIVGIDNVTRIFLAARHPKDFVSLASADHMLSDQGDADFAANMIAAWASR